MQLIPIQTRLLRSGDDLARAIEDTVQLQPNDIVVVSAKVVAVVEGATIDLTTLAVTDEAREWADTLESDKPAAFRQAVLNETKRMNGVIVSSCPMAMLTELKPEGLDKGTMMAVNAGLDTSNAPEGCAVGWPRDPVESVRRLRRDLETFLVTRSSFFVQKGKGGQMHNEKQRTKNKERRVAVVLSDSCCRPRRIGVTAMALTVSGIDPLVDQVGRKDLRGHTLRMTQEARADQLATAANALMGNADQGVPAVVIRDHGMTLSDFEGWVPGIEPEEDLFQGLL